MPFIKSSNSTGTVVDRDNYSRMIGVLREILGRGPWDSEESLMQAALSDYPRHFTTLTRRDLGKCIDYGNHILNEMGYDVVSLGPEDSSGRCCDIWEDNAPELAHNVITEADLESSIVRPKGSVSGLTWDCGKQVFTTEVVEGSINSELRDVNGDAITVITPLDYSYCSTS